MALNCEALESIVRDCSSAIGGIYPTLYINDSDNVDWDNKTLDSNDEYITAISLVGTPGVPFSVIEFRKNLGTFNEDYSREDDGAVVFDQVLTLPIHGRDAAKSRKISTIAAGQREVDIIIRQNDGEYVYLRGMTLTTVADGTGATKKEGSKYTLTFNGESERLSYYIDESEIPDLLTV